jgi:hypothetical protein
VKPLLVTISDKDRYQPKPSCAKPTSTKPVDKEQRSQVMRDRKSVLMLGSDKKEKPMENKFHGCNYSSYLYPIIKTINIDKYRF